MKQEIKDKEDIKWKVGCGRFQFGLGIITLIVGLVGFWNFIPLNKIINQGLIISSSDIILGVFILFCAIITAAVILTSSLEDMKQGVKVE